MAGVSGSADDAIAALEALKVRLTVATRKATLKSGQTLQALAVKNFQGSHAPGEWHTGGPPPNTVTGNLQRSITVWPVVPEGPGRFSVKINPTAIYSRIIELGGHITHQESEYLSWIGRKINGDFGRIYKKEVTLSPHPYFTPAYLATKTVMNGIFATYWTEAINNG